MRVVADVRQADAVTHGNVFHADEILATAILTKINPELKVARVFRVPQNLSPNTIVYDVGYGELDHHQKGGNGVRQNGVPYASAGLVWRRFGFQVVCNTCDPQAVWEHVDRVLVQGVDATDCGAMPLVKYPSQPQTISQAISGFYPTWDMDLTPDANGLTAADYAFEKAVTFMIAVLDICTGYPIHKRSDGWGEMRTFLLACCLLFNRFPPRNMVVHIANVMPGFYVQHFSYPQRCLTAHRRAVSLWSTH